MDMDMSTVMTMATTAAMPSSTMSMGGDHESHGSHGGHGGHGGNDCKISMLWNWNTIDSCFISSSWQITSSGMFAGSCIGVILLVMSLEFLRRFAHEFDQYIAGQSPFFPAPWQPPSAVGKDGNTTVVAGTEAPSSPSEQQQQQHPHSCVRSRQIVRPTLLQHIIRSLLHMVQFGVAYFIMLLAMYYNGYFIICILIGSFLGYFVFAWRSMEKNDATAVTVCCG